MIHIALAFNAEADRLRLEHILQEYAAIHQLDMRFSQFTGGEALLRGFAPYRFGVIFLDALIDDLSGIEAAKVIRRADDDVRLVFVTESEAYRREAFSLFATAYLSKPCAEEEVFRVLDHIFRMRTEHEKRFSFSFDRRYYSLPFSSLVSLETSGNYLSIVDMDGNRYRTRMTFSAATQQLDSRFLTLQKGIIVNMDHIVQISESHCEMRGGALFPIHVKNQKELRQKWQNYSFARLREAPADHAEAN